jgi:tRNA modification GTPase
MQMLLSRCLEAGKESGLRLAEPGEFTQRAFLNDKLDLAQAEAVSDLIEASTEAAAKSASQSLSGAFSKVIHAWWRRSCICVCWSKRHWIFLKKKSIFSKNRMRGASYRHPDRFAKVFEQARRALYCVRFECGAGRSAQCR